MTGVVLGTAALAMAACAPAMQGGMAASESTVRNAQGQSVGTLRVEPVGQGTRVMLRVMGMPPGTHGTHLHAVGRCDAPDFTTAGGHWNPTNRQHGLRNPQGAHLGDLPNLVVAADGTGTLTATVPVPYVPGAGSMLDPDGTALVIHATADDQVTDPSGNSGARIACAVVGAAS